MLGDIDFVPVVESGESPRLRFIGLIRNPPIMNEHVTRGFRLCNAPTLVSTGNQVLPYPPNR